MKPNRRRKAKKSSRRRSHPKRGGLTKKQRRSAAAKKAARTRAAKKARRSKAAKKAASSRRRRHGGGKRTRKAAKRRTGRKTRRAGRKTRRASGRRRGYRANKKSGRRRKASAKRSAPRRTSRRRRPSKKVARRAAKTIARFVANRRRRHHRSRRGGFRKNQFMAQLKDGLQLGAIVVGGFLAHKALTKVVSDQLLSKVDALNTGAIAPWKNVIAGALVAAAGIPISFKVLSQRNAASVSGGIAASFLHSLIVSALTQFGQPGVASYLAAYPDAEGRAFPYAGYGEYMAVNGYGAYEMAGFGSPMLSQAAAGMGGPMLSQAAAGFGAPMLSQAAAGVGEYFATGVQGIGEYEMVSGFGSSEYVDEGIPGGDLAAAERALNISEAAAGIGDIALQSTVNPLMQTLPVQDAPGGSRSGVLQGRDGIFG